MLSPEQMEEMSSGAGSGESTAMIDSDEEIELEQKGAGQTCRPLSIRKEPRRNMNVANEGEEKI